MKRFVSVLLSVLIVFNLLPAVSLAETKYVEVKKDSAPIRDTYYDVGNVYEWVGSGTALKVLDTKTNKYHNLWYKVEHNGTRGWIWEGNVRNHSHNYQRITYNGNTFGVCERCGTISVERVTTVPLKKADSLALAIPSAIGASALDGPFPFGEIAGLFIMGLALIEMSGSATETQIREMAETADLSEFSKGNDQCSLESFYKVQRAGGVLKHIDHKCMDTIQAFICVRYLGIDVWTASPSAALECAAMNWGRFFMERDSNQPSYYYHYHLGASHKDMDSNAHIFFGTNDLGESPI